MLNEEGLCFIGSKGIIELTINETKILSLLLKNKGKVITVDELQNEIYDFYHIEVVICRLRKKLKGEINIKTKYGVGYRLD